jgi:hypothetical protein
MWFALAADDMFLSGTWIALAETCMWAHLAPLSTLTSAAVSVRMRGRAFAAAAVSSHVLGDGLGTWLIGLAVQVGLPVRVVVFATAVAWAFSFVWWTLALFNRHLLFDMK